MRVKRIFIDHQDRDSVIVGSTREFIEQTYSCPIELLDGIPLTEEILSEIGFEWDFVTATYKFNGITIIDNEEQGYYALLSQLDFSLTVPIPYLHNLQNLYFIIKGEELPIAVSHLDEEEQ
jgi:hypothetical protein